jgi:hypothetical protein
LDALASGYGFQSSHSILAAGLGKMVAEPKLEIDEQAALVQIEGGCQ